MGAKRLTRADRRSNAPKDLQTTLLLSVWSAVAELAPTGQVTAEGLPNAWRSLGRVASISAQERNRFRADFVNAFARLLGERGQKPFTPADFGVYSTSWPSCSGHAYLHRRHAGWLTVFHLPAYFHWEWFTACPPLVRSQMCPAVLCFACFLRLSCPVRFPLPRAAWFCGSTMRQPGTSQEGVRVALPSRTKRNSRILPSRWCEYSSPKGGYLGGEHVNGPLSLVVVPVGEDLQPLPDL